MLPFVAGAGPRVGVASRMLERYRSETLIMVMPQRISTEILPQMVNDQIEDRLPSISDQIHEPVASRADHHRLRPVSAGARAAATIMEDVVAAHAQGHRGRHRSSTASSRSGSATRATMPATAHKVTERLASLYIEENLKDKDNLRRARARSSSPSSRCQARGCSSTRRRSRNTRSSHAGQLPVAARSRISRRFRTRSCSCRRSATDQPRARAPAAARSSSSRTRRLRRSASPLRRSRLASAGAGRSLTAAQQLETAEGSACAAKQRYTPDHPDIRTLERVDPRSRAKVDAEARRAARSTPQGR